ncbi:hypothetical protein AAC387_Pa01g2792 [Persea americana]
MSILQGVLFPPPPSLYMTAMSVVGLVAVSYCGLAEVRGKHLQYSKFWNVQSKGKGKEGIKLSSRAGMLLLYTPAFVAGAASLAFYPSPSLRFWLLSWALTIHFLKRVLEVLFVHKYSGGMILDSAILISLSYFTATVNALYAQYLAEGTPEPQIDLKYAGIVVFLVGIAGNFYHHYLLSKLREKNDKGYKIPRGGLFNLVICPHYLFEILVFIGISCISQTVYASSFTIGTIGYLMGRSYATRKWYRTKFSNFPAEVKALIPFVF